MSEVSTGSSEPEHEAGSGQSRRLRASTSFRSRYKFGQSGGTLREGLEQLMPIALAQAAGEATERVLAVSDRRAQVTEDTETATNDARDFARALTAALGTIAPSLTATAVENWIGKTSNSWLALVPKWLRPAIDPTRRPRVMTMTSFANDRSRVVREAIDESVPVLISRRGRIMAAVVPLEAGAYEAEVYRDAGRERLTAMSERPAVELDDATVEQILSSDNPEAVASALGIDTSDWASLNPSGQD